MSAAKKRKQGTRIACPWNANGLRDNRWRARETAQLNGKVPGELITTRGGDTLRIRVKNSLPPVDSAGWNGSHNVPHMFDATNLHLHGLDVIPHLFEPVGTGIRWRR